MTSCHGQVVSGSLLRLGGKSAAIAAKGSMLQTPGDCGGSGNMRMAAVCAPAICFKRSIATQAAAQSHRKVGANHYARASF
jgi:hypothetical protein